MKAGDLIQLWTIRDGKRDFATDGVLDRDVEIGERISLTTVDGGYCSTCPVNRIIPEATFTAIKTAKVSKEEGFGCAYEILVLNPTETLV